MTQLARTSTRRRLVLLTVAAATGTAILAGTQGANAATTTAATGLEQRNLATVQRAYTEFFGQGKTERVGQFFAKDVIQHDPTLADGQAALVASVRTTQAQTPRPVTTIKHVLADGSLVAVHAQTTTTPGNEATGQASVELYRLANNRIVEHWSLVQNVPATTASGNTMFSDLYTYSATAPTPTKAQEDANKQLVLKAWDGMFMARDLTLLDRYWAPGSTYLQHNPYIPNGTSGLKGFLATMPSTVSQNRFALADGDLVLTINQSIETTGDLNSDIAGTAVADLYRVVDSRIVEHWDVVEPVPATSASGHSMFSSLYQES